MRVLKLTAATVVLASLLALAPLTAAPALAAPSLPVLTTDPPDFTPSGSKWKAWMLNIVSSVLGGATPDKWKAEQLANAHRYNHSWDQFAAQFGYSANSRNALGEMMPIPAAGDGTYDDYVIAQYEEQMKRGGAGSRPMAPPATKTATFVKTAGGALAVVTAYQVGNFLGAQGANAVGGWFGWDPNGAVCGSYNDGSLGSIALRFISGQDCAAWDYNNAYVINADAASVTSMTYGAASVTYLGSTGIAGCSRLLGSVGSGYTIEARSVDPYTSTGWVTLNSAGAGPCSTPFPTANSNWAKGGATPGFRVRQLSNSAIVATSTTTATDPDRRLRCRNTYTDGTHQDAFTGTYKESQGLPQPVCAPIPSGKTPSSVKVTDQQTANTPAADQDVYNEPVTDEFQEWWDDYPECRSGACKLDLIRVLPAPAVSCFDLEDGCVDWHTDPDKEDTYLCRYGVHDVALSQCNAYAGLFQPGRVTTGSPYSDPSTGEWSGGKSSPQVGESIMTSTLRDPASLRSCDWTGVGFDIVAAALRAGQCLMEWTFVARPAVADVAFAGVQEVWADKPPGAIAAAVEDLSLSGGATGCSITTTYKGTTTPLVDACGGFMGALATFTRFATFVLMAFAVFHKVRQQIAGMVNYNVGQD